jgi:hypothetical protein
MNERIRELAKQVTRQYSPTYYTEEWASQFAKLIVEECIKEARKDENGPAYEAVARIARHFGVE